MGWPPKYRSRRRHQYRIHATMSVSLLSPSSHPLSPSPHTRRGGTKGESRVPPLHIVERGTGGEDHERDDGRLDLNESGEWEPAARRLESPTAPHRARRDRGL